MAYLFRQKIDLRELAGAEYSPRLIMLAEPEEYLLALYSYYLQNYNFIVKNCADASILEEMISAHNPSLLFFNPGFYGKISQAASFLKKMMANFPFLQVVTIGNGVSEKELKLLMQTGIVSHIERRLSKPKDIVAVAETIFNN
jgi:hypothetical protein